MSFRSRESGALAACVLLIQACSSPAGPDQPPLPPPPPPIPVATVVVSPGTLGLAVTQTGTLTVQLRDASGNTLGNRTITWSTSAADVATVSTAGLVTAVRPGLATITATSEGRAGSAEVTVSPGPTTAVVLTAADSSLEVGQTVQLTAAARDAQGNPVTGRPISWSSSAPTVATVSGTGVVTALAGGTSTLSATIDGVSGSVPLTVAFPAPAFGLLEIHQINVGWGSSTFVRGPNGLTVLLEAGNTGDGTADVVPYLKSVGLQPANGLDYTIAGHQHCDHLGGMDEVINAGYEVRQQNFFNGSTTTSSCVTQWAAAATSTSAGPHVVPLIGSTIDLGDGAVLRFIAVNGSIIGGATVPVTDENDRSIAVLIQYRGFDYLWGSDMGGGDSDNACTGRSTSQRDVETPLIQAISPGGSAPLITAGGIDVLYVNHHGSESSTNSTYLNMTRPAVAIIPVGAGQAAFQLPRKAVVDNVLFGAGPCITAPSPLVLQSEDGLPMGTETSAAGFSVGDVVVSTDGRATFSVTATGRLAHGIDERPLAGLPRALAVDGTIVGILASIRPVVLERQ